MRKLRFPHPYSWYIRRGYGTHAIRNKREAKALYDFCAEQLVELCTRRPECRQPRAEIYQHTMEIYRNNFEIKLENLSADLIWCECGHCSGVFAPYDIWQYTNEHSNWYWS